MAEVKKRVFGLRSQLIGGIVVLTVAAISMMGMLSLKVIEQKAIYAKASEARLIADFFHLSAGGGKEELKKFALRAIKEGQIRDVHIVDRQRRVILGKEQKVPLDTGRTLILDNRLVVRHSGAKAFGSLTGILSANTTLKNGTTVRFTVSLGDIVGEIRAIKRYLFYFSAIYAVIIIALGAYFLSKLIIRPIRDLERTAGLITGGDLSVRAQTNTKNNDEIASLALSFNAMADTVVEKIKSIEDVNKHLISTREKLITTEKLATAGRLAAGIAHEIGNPLGAVQGYVDILASGGVEKADEEEIIERMGKEISRINKIVKDFLDISRPMTRPPVAVDINAVVKESVLAMSAHSELVNIKTELKLDTTLPRAMVDEDMLKQVFINLLINSADAMSGEGVVTISTFISESAGQMDAEGEGRRKTDTRAAFPSEAEPSDAGAYEPRSGRMVVVSFTDTGPGIGPDEGSKIFEPFYTTKDLTKGTGLGLFICKEIVEAYRGDIELLEGKGKGATFTVALPAEAK